MPVAIVPREAGIEPEASWSIAEGSGDGSHQRSLGLGSRCTLVALDRNGERLRPPGVPTRLFVPGWEGNVDVKGCTGSSGGVP